MSPLSTSSQSQQQRQQPQQAQAQAQAHPRTTLRRAIYVHVSDLTSSYNINHARLEQELARVKAESDASEPGATEIERETDLGGSQHALDIDPALTQQHPQKKLHPPRGGYNLCV